jgi:hypothetical protein
MSGVKRERWTELDVLALPSGEHDYFDRKSGALLVAKEFRLDMAKALSAFANSGGGHLVLGVRDDGTLDGVPAIAKGRTTTREWLEQTIPHMLNYPLEDFRVHEVESGTPSSIPTGKVVIVVDVGDSVIAPHQAADTRLYYYRERGHSKPASHFYLETLRNRLVNPVLKAALERIEFATAFAYENGIFIETRVHFRITNIGRTAVYKWFFCLDAANFVDERRSDYRFSNRLAASFWPIGDSPYGDFMTAARMESAPLSATLQATENQRLIGTNCSRSRRTMAFRAAPDENESPFFRPCSNRAESM